MTLVDATKEVHSRFLSLWDEDDAAFGFENDGFEPPAADPWVRLFVRHATRVQSTLGGPGARTFNSQGLILAQVFVTRDQGRRAMDELAEKVRTIFEGVEFNGVRCYATNVRELGTDGPWFQGAADTQFDYDETK